MLVYVLVWNNEDFVKLEKDFSSTNKDYHLVPITPPSETSYLYQYYQGGEQIDDPIELQTYIGHIKIVRAFLESGEEECIVCEDFVHLSKSFHQEFISIRSNIPESIGLVSLAHEADSWQVPWTGICPERENLCSITPDVYGSACYYLKASWAIDVLKFFDKPMNRLPREQRDVETFIRYSGGYVSYPTLAVYGNIAEDNEKYF